jgi:hypothetical protein
VFDVLDLFNVCAGSVWRHRGLFRMSADHALRSAIGGVNGFSSVKAAFTSASVT